VKEIKAAIRRFAPQLERWELIPPRTVTAVEPRPPNPQAIRRLIQTSGYPLELDLFHELHERGADPVHSFRIPFTKEDIREIDLIGRHTAREQFDEGNQRPTATFTLLHVVEAKSWNPARVFIGFVGENPTAHELLIQRTRIAGSPTFNVLHDGGAVPEFVLEFGAPMSLLNDAPMCMQWGATGPGGGPLNHDEATYEALTMAIEASIWFGKDHSTFLRTARDPSPMMEVVLPVLVIDTPTLYIFDVRSGVLTQTERLVIRMMWTLRDGVSGRLVDVVTRKGFSQYLETCDRVGAEIQSVLAREVYNINLLHQANLRDARDPLKNASRR